MTSTPLALLWILLNLFSTIMLAFFSMGEMAAISFNKIRLQYYVSNGSKRANWLNYLIQNPERLFGTTLIGVNVAMFFGSECARQSYLELGINPDYAVATQVVFVLIFGELAPMFAARRYAEHVAMLGAPLLYASAKLLSPVLWSISWLSRLIDWLLSGARSFEHHGLNQDDMQKILESLDEEYEKDDGVNTVVKNILSLQTKQASEVMQKIETVPTLSANATLEQLKKLLIKPDLRYVPIYQRAPNHIIGIVDPRDFIRFPDSRRIREHATAPWFITEKTSALAILKDFKRNNKDVAIVLNDQGLSVGMITLDDLTEELFGALGEEKADKVTAIFIDRTFPGSMKVSEFNKQFDVILSEEEDLTLAELMHKILDYHPEVGESIFLPPFELTVKETTLTEVKTLSINSRK